MEPKVSIQTPEHIEFQYELAGIGARFLALFIDTLIQIGAMAILIVLFIIFFFILGKSNPFLKIGWRSPSAWITAIIILALYIIKVGYFTFFETIWSGQTPGKKRIAIRVIKEDGRPIGFTEAMIRNIMRIIDILPANYLVGVLTMFISVKEKRVGDYVAGTIVVKETSQTIPQTLESFSSYETILEEVTPYFSRITKEEYAIIADFLDRRFELDHEHRLQIARQIALPLIKKLELSQPINMRYEEFLVRLNQTYRKYSKFL